MRSKPVSSDAPLPLLPVSHAVSAIADGAARTRLHPLSRAQLRRRATPSVAAPSCLWGRTRGTTHPRRGRQVEAARKETSMHAPLQSECLGVSRAVREHIITRTCIQYLVLFQMQSLTSSSSASTSSKLVNLRHDHCHRLIGSLSVLSHWSLVVM
jgi:hypothetical protein